MSQDILIFAEQRGGKIQNLSLELIQGSQRIAGQLGGRVVCMLPGCHTAETAGILLKAGAAEVLVIDDPALAQYRPSYYTKAVTAAVQASDAALVLFGSTSIGLETAARTAGRLHTGLVTDCTGIHIQPETLEITLTRPGTDGISIDTFGFGNCRPKMAAIRPGVLAVPASGAPGADVSRTQTENGRIRRIKADFTDIKNEARILSTSPGRKQYADISQARVLAAAGRGIGGPEGLRLLQKTAELLGGETACSRACVESGWMDASRQVGQTGRTVRPELYLACGISGAFQHVTGMEGAQLIISINKNPSAPIFDISDLGIVGSTEVILPALIKALETYTITH